MRFVSRTDDYIGAQVGADYQTSEPGNCCHQQRDLGKGNRPIGNPDLACHLTNLTDPFPFSGFDQACTDVDSPSTGATLEPLLPAQVRICI